MGTLRRECLDQMVIFGEAHLRRILSAYAAYYNQARTHLALQKDAPLQQQHPKANSMSMASTAVCTENSIHVEEMGSPKLA
jgi:hypothetical protein